MLLILFFNFNFKIPQLDFQLVEMRVIGVAVNFDVVIFETFVETLEIGIGWLVVDTGSSS